MFQFHSVRPKKLEIMVGNGGKALCNTLYGPAVQAVEVKWKKIG